MHPPLSVFTLSFHRILHHIFTHRKCNQKVNKKYEKNPDKLGMKKLIILLESENIDKKVLLDVFNNYLEIKNFLTSRRVLDKSPLMIEIEHNKVYCSN